MWVTSAAFNAAIVQPHRMVSRVDVCTQDGTVLLPGLGFTAGAVTVDSRQATRRTLTLTVPDVTGTLTPAAAGDLLSPLSGNELRVYRGVIYPDATGETVPLGVFRLSGNPTLSGRDGTILTLSGVDRSGWIAANRWIGPYVIQAGTALETAIQAAMTSRWPGAQANFSPTGAVTIATTFGLDSGAGTPMDDLIKLAMDTAGLDLYFDQQGIAQMVPPADPFTASPVYTYTEDRVAVVDDASKAWDVANVFNAWQVTGESSNTTPVSVIVYDDDPSSPTYYFGPIGARPDPTVVTSQATTTAQATAVGQAKRAKARGVGQTLTWSQLVNPALDAGDAVSFTRAKLRVTSDIAVLDSLVIPLTADQLMTATTRSKQVAA